MNFLAHLFLSGLNQEVIVGNLLEDFVVGRIDHPRNASYNSIIKDGILLHRLIDSFTDTHLAVSDCKSLLYSKYHKYAAVLVDIYFDHFLALHWDEYSDEPFPDFRKRVHQAFLLNWEILPENMKPMIESMIKYDWLKNYSEFWGIERALQGISRRTVYESNMQNATEDLKIHYQLFEDKFKVFFPEMISQCKNFLDKKGYIVSNILQ
ncbi:Acyl carrier protein phosphodiesterase [Emticicia aquatica]|uniref:Acyl carrier protein phosphodiesterase n=1 Tax=Emticicia aquatica TaxID=1681835 RepID=A0ABM9AMF4_9BACT|nr:ACP phosphodiesterase [Emticicia aquatica]CAH0994967.1 Acyl carrier protein phosphodiesterase [Emticicia aquatica]